MLTAEMVKRFGRECGADAVGIGSPDRFDGAPREMDPRYIFPAAKSVIGFIFRIPRGYIRGIEEGTHFFQYPSMGYSSINETFAPSVLYQVGRFIEDQGYEACVYRNTGGRGPVSDMTGKPGGEESPELEKRAVRYSRAVAPDRPPPDVQFHFRIAAFTCGLGEIGYSKMFMTPQFGPLNRQAFLFTDAELEPDPLYAGPPLCNRCMACVSQCSGHCLSATETVRITVAGRPVEWAKLDEWKCFAHYIGAAKESNPFMPRDVFKGLPDGDRILRGERTITADEYGEIARRIRSSYPGCAHYNPPKCGGCLRACIASCERRGILQNKMVNPFRTGKPWKVEWEAKA
ncbi:MAG: hypothetical protein A3K18_32890 [Lentisphaerae bacterium RIFOXYA12_64_32]|nr:MAG: hypothetical protein A3K18_32890 [Lentisphaerae bacterium RIFOXYA12_64_32]